MADTEPHGRAYRLYEKYFLSGSMPYVTVAVVIAVTLFFAYHARKFKMDASSDSITLENDKDQKYYDRSREVFGSDDYVFLVVTPEKDLFSEEVLSELKVMIGELIALPGFASVTSIMNVPLFHSPDVALMSLASGYNTLEKPEIDRNLARKELMESPLFSDYIISKDGKSTILQATFKRDDVFSVLLLKRYNLREKEKEGALTPEEKAELAEVEKQYKHDYMIYSDGRDKNIADVRAVMAKHESLGRLHLGGFPMITSDMIGYIKRDFAMFGTLVLIFIAIMMAVIFRRLKLFVLPMLACIFTLIIMIGYLGFRDWHVTVVTANFAALLLIMSTENAILLASSWREILGTHPEKSRQELVSMIVLPVAVPCAYSTATTMVGFGSLIVSGIRPVMDFGIMMTFGLTAGFLVCFLFIPAMLAILPKERPVNASELNTASDSAISVYARFTESHPRIVNAIALALFIFGLLGIRQLTVENRFMDYFRKNTAIYQGMHIVDNNLGGTTPLEVILDGDKPDYWLEPENLEKLRKAHMFLDGLPETGKVISLDTMVRLLEGINKKPINKMIINLVRKNLPEKLARDILQPYVTPDFQKARITMRIKESGDDLNRKELVQKIRDWFQKEGYQLEGNAHVTGIFVLYNNMLQTLFRSQIATVSTVFFSCFIVFSLIFRNIWLALMGLVPNALAVTIILGTIGWLGIPLDMMTIMIAAITFGLADDNTIHYIHAFQQEFPKDRDYLATMYRCHNSIGRALSYSMITIVFGFGVLVFSNFKPTVYFGIFTGIAMFLALTAAHTLLPLMILHFKPLGKGRAPVESGTN